MKREAYDAICKALMCRAKVKMLFRNKKGLLAERIVRPMLFDAHRLRAKREDGAIKNYPCRQIEGAEFLK